MSQKNPITPEENKTANILSGISLACMLFPTVIGSVETAIIQAFYEAGAETPVWTTLFSSLGGIAFVASIVLIVIVRVKYPGNVFGKVLMWVYIVLGIVMAVALIALAIACGLACNSCMDSCRGLS